MQLFDSDKVLAGKGYPALRFSRSERTPMAIRSELLNPKGQPTSERRLEMKQILIVITLVVASAAPAMAEGFPNVYATHLGR